MIFSIDNIEYVSKNSEQIIIDLSAKIDHFSGCLIMTMCFMFIDIIA